MTNWMTAAGIALIAGGLATLICFRSVLFGRGDRRVGTAEPADIQPVPRGGKGSRRRGREPLIPPAEEDARGALASIGLDEENEELFSYAGDQRAIAPGPEPEIAPFAAEPEIADFAPDPAELVGLELVPDLAPEADPIFDDLDDEEPADSGDRYGHRVQGWVRPEYEYVPEEPPAGEYWTPIPVDLEPDHEPSAKGYGWPARVERLPSVPNYEPATGFDLAPVEHEPTEFVVARSDEQRARMPRSWSARNDKRDRREWRTENEALPTTQLFAAASDDPASARRRRPRPRPRPSVEPPDRSTRMYVSRHAAEPPPR